jgi:A/G-specific adenine glycosylase
MEVNLPQSIINKFQLQILNYYRKHGRKMPWRETCDPYRIFVSEIMLQQTQVSRVEEKYKQFVAAFSDFTALDNAPLSRVYAVWQGLGYNRRALSLKKAAQVVAFEHHGVLPHTEEALMALPGIGKATASSIMAFAFNLPVVFIETNIRTVFIHFFFKKKSLVSDEEIVPLVRKCLYKKSPRVWYWALMDYGAMLKNTGQDKNSRSKHYKKQSRFEGSRRQLRGGVLRAFLSNSYVNVKGIIGSTKQPRDRVVEIVDALAKEGFIVKSGGNYKLREKVE